MIVHNHEQRSEAWHQCRLGRLTGSAAADMLAKIGKGEAAARRDLRMRLVCERLTSRSQDDGFVNADMQRGMDMEPIAFAAYEAETGNVVRRTGFLAHDELMAGCSLDGDVDDFDGILEIKCPRSATHLGYLRAGVVPAKYLPQITHNVWISGAKFADFVSFDDRFPPELQYFRARIKRSDLSLSDYETAVRFFLAEVDADFEALSRMAEQVA